jgi:hypothetical protein
MLARVNNNFKSLIRKKYNKLSIKSIVKVENIIATILTSLFINMTLEKKSGERNICQNKIF